MIFGAHKCPVTPIVLARGRRMRPLFGPDKNLGAPGVPPVENGAGTAALKIVDCQMRAVGIETHLFVKPDVMRRPESQQPERDLDPNEFVGAGVVSQNVQRVQGSTG